MAYQRPERSTKGPLGARLAPAVALVDGNMMAKQAYHTTGDLVSETTGQNVGVLFGFIKMLGTIMWEFPSVEEIHVLWDSYPSWRAVEFPYYKAARGARLPSTDPAGEATWEEQKKMLQEILPILGVHQMRVPGLEADDLAYLVPRSELVGNRISILVSNDRDWLQLVDDKTFVFRNAKKDLVTPENFGDVTKYGKPEYVIELKALMGDGDEFPGAPGIGEKSALAYLNGDDLQEFRLRKIEAWLETEQYRQNMILASIPACESRGNLDSMELRPGVFDQKIAFKKFRELEFYSVIERWQDFCSRYGRLKEPGGKGADPVEQFDEI